VRLASLLLTFDPQDHDYRFHGWSSSERAFVAVGPPGFTALALIKLGDHARGM